MKKVLAGVVAGVLITASAGTAAVKTLRNGDKVFYGNSIYCQTRSGAMVCANWHKPGGWMVGIDGHGVYLGKGGKVIITRSN